MKIITFFFLTLVVLGAGCFDGDHGILTELLVNPAPSPEIPLQPLGETVKAGTGSDMVISPVPLEIQDALWGTWEELMDDLKEVMLLHKGGQHLNADGELVVTHLSPTVTPLFAPVCENRANRDFYDKYIDAGGIVILANANRDSGAYVRDEFLYVARQIILTMTSEMPALRQALSPENGFYYVLVGAARDEVNMPDELGLLSRFAGFFTASDLFGTSRYLEVFADALDILDPDWFDA